MLKPILIYLAAINLIAFLMMGADKLKAVKGRWRISERALFVSALLGGSLGAIVGMRVFHHKTLHRKFTIGMPLILMAQLALIFCLWRQYSGI
ncbi:MAG: DUF1294 domain-containing protein [Firmicutes bacterium]|nr:DUF1294 domain-containing protein [Bacillota bacterium]